MIPTSRATLTVPCLLDDADALRADRDRLAGLLYEPRRSGCAVEIAGVRIAPCDERGQTADMRALDAAADRLAHMTEARDNARAEVERLATAVRQVRELHRESNGSMSALYPNPICECGKDYPCPTIRAIETEARRLQLKGMNL